MIECTTCGRRRLVKSGVVDEITVATSRCGPFNAAIRLLKRDLVDIEQLIDARYSLDDGVEAMSKARQKGVLKVLVEM